MVEESFNVRLNDEVYASLLNGATKFIQCLMLRASRSIAVRTSYKVRFVYLPQHPYQRQSH